MANVNLIAGTAKTFSLDTTTLGALTSVTFTIYEQVNKKLTYKYKYPASEGFKTVTLVGSTYSFTLSDSDSLLLNGVYGVQVEWVKSGSTYIERAGTIEVEPSLK